MSAWRLTTFGAVSLRDAEGRAPAIAGQRRPLALLALLAVAGDAGQSRDKLLPYLWPESDEERARNALRQLIHLIRKGLREDDLLFGTGDLRLNPALMTSDVQDFGLALQQGDAERAARLYRGPFLDGFHIGGIPEFDYWVETMRADLATRAGSAMESMARTAATGGDTAGAVGWWRQRAVLDPLDSRVAVELMRAFVAEGNPGGALQHARVHEELVHQELGGAPDPAVAQLAERIRQQGAGTAAAPTPPARSVHAAPPTQAPKPPAAAPKPPVVPSLRERLQAALVERYEILRELPRREGTTRCFAARDLQHHRSVILKVLHPSLASAIDLQRFLREIAFTARLNHPHIVPLLDSSQVAGQPWYAVPDLQGESLRDLMARQGETERAWVIELVADLAEALGYAHREGIVHRDVRPETIVLAGRQGLLGNFGVSAALEAAADARLTLSGVLVGAPAYASPEQMVGAAPAPASDVYSLGVVLYELLIGQPPFSGPTTHAILVKRAAAAPGWELRPELPPGIRETLRRMLAEDPARRPAAPDVASALRDSPDQAEPAPGHKPVALVANLFRGLARRFRPGG